MPRGIGGELLWWCPSLDDSGNGTTTLNDLSASANNGTLTNMVTSGAGNDWVADTASGGVRALDFDGVNDVVIGASQSVGNFGTSDFTVALWARPTANSAYANLVCKRNESSPFNQWLITQGNVSSAGDAVQGSHCSFFLYIGSGSLSSPSFVQSFRTTASVFDGNYHHIVWQRVSGSGMLCWIDGVSVEVTAIVNGTTNLNANHNNPVRLGSGSNAGTAFPFSGRLDDMRIFGRVLTQAEIARLASRRGYQKPAGSAAVHFFFAGF